MDLKKMIRAGKLITVTGTVQILGGCAAAFALFWLLPFPHATGVLPVLYLAVAATLASTVIVIKTLQDKNEIDTLPGRITVGILVLQDLFAIVFLALQPNLLSPAMGPILVSLARVVVIMATGFLCSRYLLPAVFKGVAKSPELVLVSALGWCFAMTSLASALELSREMGALIAGVSLSTFPYAVDLSGRVTSLRDFFITLFFVALGMVLPLPDWSHVLWGLAFCGVLIATRLITVFPPLHVMKQGFRTSLIPGINLCQVSELSLVILSLGISAGHVDVELSTVVAVAFVVLALDSGFVLARNHQIASWVSPWLIRLGLHDLDEASPKAEDEEHPRIVLLGFFRTASSLLDHIRRTDSALLSELAILDLNPQVYGELKRRGMRVQYADINARETLEHAGVAHAELIVCTLPDSILRGGTNRRLLRILRPLNPTAQILVPAETLEEVAPLYEAGASYVYLPRMLEAEHILETLRAADQGLLEEQRRSQRELLDMQDEVLP
jgi:Kef-type K+ transport system membrane component KefB